MTDQFRDNNRRVDMSVWQGRVDEDDGTAGLRFHQTVKPANAANEPGIMLLGFACDEGVARNKGRTGAYQAPTIIRQALANMAWHHLLPIYDSGDIACDDHNLAEAQNRLSADVTEALRQQHFPVVIGGGHEVAWGSFQGIARYLSQRAGNRPPRIGIINFDAHFDLRPLSGDSKMGSSGTPFTQAANLCAQNQWPFHYACVGISRTSNTQALFNTADKLGVTVIEDWEITQETSGGIIKQLEQFAWLCDFLYITVDLDVLPASVAPGVSAPAVHGVSYSILESLYRHLVSLRNEDGSRKVILADFAEYNPRFDSDNQTARIAARLIWQVCRDISTE
ncbi:formimidoylglutamase [Parasalinivibrio latis]|uniref:formimidoylglutamase n=1 Tax=Parasalinivibrio latis TaxID=2952610 RepID=UPI0030E2786E